MNGTVPGTRLDLRAIAERADLRGLLSACLGHPDMRNRWRCPFHADDAPSLYLFDDGRRWRCWPCGINGDALDFLTRFENIGVAEAARRLDPLAGGQSEPARRAPAPPPKAAAKLPAWQHAGWQAALDALVCRAEADLWAPEGAPARAWLHARGLAPDTIRRFRLGYFPAEGRGAAFDRPDGERRGLYHPRGVAIPWPAPGAWYDPSGEAPAARWAGCNVRCLAPDPFAPLPPKAAKCLAIKGSARGNLYPWPDLLPTQGTPPALIVEGEFDALVATQEVGHLAFAGTVGGSNQAPDRSALATLARCSWWLVATDHDQAGVDAAHAWRHRGPHKARRVLLPSGKDLGEFHADGGDVAGWLAGELARLRIAPDRAA